MLSMKPISFSCPSQCRRRFVATVVVSAAALVSGCSLIPAASPDPTRYFVLSGPEGVAPARVPDVPVAVLASVEIPGYLRTTRNLVVRTAGNEVTFVEGARWGEALDLGLARILRETLAAEGRVGRVVQPPLSAQAVETRPVEIRVQIQACEGRRLSDGTWVTTLVARYDVARPAASGASAGAPSGGMFVAAERRWDGRTHGELARLLSEAAADLAREIGERLAVAP